MNTLSTLNVYAPNLCQEWLQEANLPLTPSTVKANCYKLVAWKCKKCKKTWNATIRERAMNGKGCPFCVNRKVYVGRLV